MRLGKQLLFALAAAIALVVAIAYLPALDAAYVWDDDTLVAKDMRCRGDVLRCFTLPFFPPSPFLDLPRAYYRPLVTASFAIGGAVRSQHGWNVALHAANAVLLFLLALRHGAPPLRASAGALVWSLHPRFVEAVTWVVGRTDLLATTFMLGALLAWPFDEVADDRPRRRREAFAAVLVLFGMLSKEVAVAGAAAIAVACVASQGTRRGLVRALPIGVAVAIYAGLRAVVLGASAGAAASNPSMGVRAAAPFETIGRYVEMTALFYSPWSARGATGIVSLPHVALGAVVVAVAVVALVRVVRRGAPLQVASSALAAVSLLAVSQIVPVALHGALTADRLLYVPLAGVVLAAVARRASSQAAERAAAAFALAIAAASSIVVRRETKTFADDVTFLTTVAERADPANVGPRNAVAAAVRDRGAPDLACPLFARSRAVLEATARRGTPAYRRTTENLAACFVRTGRPEMAVALYRSLEGETERAGRVALELGYALLAQLDFDGADAAFARAAAEHDLAKLATKLRGDVANARENREAVERRPDGDHATRARFAASVGRAADAEREWSLVVADARAPVGLRLEGAQYLALDAALEVADRAVAACGECREIDPSLARTIEARRALVKPVVARADRIAGL